MSFRTPSTRSLWERLAPASRQWLVLLLAVGGTAPIGAAVIDVGVGPGCEAATLAAAIDLADDTVAADEIRLLDGVVYTVSGTLQLTDWNHVTKGALTISGGYSDCLDTTIEEFGRSTIRTSGGGPVIQVDTTGGNPSILTLEAIEVSNSAARGIVVDGNGDVSLINTLVFQNGGGVAVTGGATFSMDPESQVSSNDGVSFGGGIYCSGLGSELQLQGKFSHNDATNGGALAVVDGCEALLVPPLQMIFQDAIVGGSIYAASGALVSGLQGGVTLQFTNATSTGGAIAASGSGTQVLLAGVRILGAEAGFRGGAIYASDSAYVALGAHDEACLDSNLPYPNHCPSVIDSGDLDTGGHDGATAIAVSGAEVRLLQTKVTRSSIDSLDPGGSILHATGPGSLIRTESVEVARGFDITSAFQAENGGALEVAMTTVANVEFSPGIPSEGVRIDGAGTTAQIYSSIFYPVASYQAASGASFTAVDCLITSTTDGLTGGSYVLVADPLFVGPDFSDFNLQRGSPAIDYCDDDIFSPTVAGLDGSPRGYDDPHDPNGNPGVPNAFAVFDLGAYPLGFLFADGFESGNTSAWDS